MILKRQNSTGKATDTSYTRESQVESALIRGLDALGYECIKFLPFHKTGMPDRLVLLPKGRVHWIELKTEKGVLSEIQKLRHIQLSKQGHTVFVLKGMDDVEMYLHKLEQSITT